MASDHQILEQLIELIASTEARTAAKSRELIEKSNDNVGPAQQRYQGALLAENLLALKRLRLQVFEML